MLNYVKKILIFSISMFIWKGRIMKKTYKRFNSYLLAISITAAVGLIFALFSLLFYYNADLKSIEYKNVIPILTVIIFAIAVVFAVVFTAQTDTIHITKIKKNSSILKFATLLSVALSVALFLYDFIFFVIYPNESSPLKIARLTVFLPFIAYLIIEVIPTRMHRRVFRIPTWLKVITSLSTIIWCVLGLLAMYFWSALATTNIFKLHHMFYYVLAVLFFMFEIKFELISHKGHRGYMLSALVLFSYTFISTGAIIIVKFAGGLVGVNISNFEMFLPLAIGLYALSKMIAIKNTINFVMKRDLQSVRSHSHRSHKHNNSTHHHDDADEVTVVENKD